MTNTPEGLALILKARSDAHGKMMGNHGFYTAANAAVDAEAAYALTAQAEEIERLRAGLEEILCCHDGNMPDALNMPELDYARRTITTIHRLARSLLPRIATETKP